MEGYYRQASSYRDPGGFLFFVEGELFCQVNKVYKDNYDHLKQSGLYEELVQSDLLIPHEEATIRPRNPEQAYKVLKPTQPDFISYPYEWCFSQFKDASLLTLEIARKALDFDMLLKAASANNIQFQNCRPVWIDTLSFEKYQDGQPWGAYGEFCQHFLAPLALMAYQDVRLNQLLRIYLNGVPLDLAARLLPLRTRVKSGLLEHIHSHARNQRRDAGQSDGNDAEPRQMSKDALIGLIDSLESAIQRLSWNADGKDWIGYTDDATYTQEAIEHKKQLVSEFIEKASPDRVWDIGANFGEYSRLASNQGAITISFDNDPSAVDKNYRLCKEQDEILQLPLIMDLTNPSPGTGWMNQERMSFVERGPVDLVLALGLIQHLAITNNVPFMQVADFLSRMGKWLIIEFAPKQDLQVQRLLAPHEDSFEQYTRAQFEKALGEYFWMQEAREIKDSDRILYLLENLQN
jgi:hypothetical protein